MKASQPVELSIRLPEKDIRRVDTCICRPEKDICRVDTNIRPPEKDIRLVDMFIGLPDTLIQLTVAKCCGDFLISSLVNSGYTFSRRCSFMCMISYAASFLNLEKTRFETAIETIDVKTGTTARADMSLKAIEFALKPGTAATFDVVLTAQQLALKAA